VNIAIWNHYFIAALILNEGLFLAHTLITSNIFKRVIFDKNEAEKTIYSEYPHIHAIYKNLGQKNMVYIFPETIIKVREQRAKSISKLSNFTFQTITPHYALCNKIQMPKIVHLWFFLSVVKKCIFCQQDDGQI